MSVPGGGVCLLGGSAWGGASACLIGRSASWKPPVNRMTDRCKNITFSQLRWRAVRKKLPSTLFAVVAHGSLTPLALHVQFKFPEEIERTKLFKNNLWSRYYIFSMYFTNFAKLFRVEIVLPKRVQGIDKPVLGPGFFFQGCCIISWPTCTAHILVLLSVCLNVWNYFSSSTWGKRTNGRLQGQDEN